MNMKKSVRVKKENKNKIKELEQRYKVINENLTNDFTEEKRQIESELDILYTAKAKGAQVRSRAQWIEEGEKNTKYFMQLEKSRQDGNVIQQLLKENKRLTSNSEILGGIGAFYKNLYTTRSLDTLKVNAYLNDINNIDTLSDTQRQFCDGMPTLKEIQDTVLTLKKGKTPGSDGLPIEFYLKFWKSLEKPFYSFVVESSLEGELSSTSKHAIISLIFKKGDKHLLKNYRPISLTNTDYKIIAFVFAKRLQQVLPSIINQDQSGYLKGRFIGNNIRTVIDVFDYCQQENHPGALVFLDYQKAFDTVEWNFIFKVLEKFNFGDDFIRWIKLLYKNPTFSVKNNGWISKKQKMYRGIRQGCPLSALLFIIVVEILGIQIRNNKRIKGFSFGQREYKISQYADDGILLVQDEESILQALKTVNEFSDVAGPNLNMDKVEGIWLGPLKNSMPKNYANISWTQEPVRCLGIYVGHNIEKCYELNWSNKLQKIKNMFMLWKQRHLTIWGKITVIRTVALPVVIHTASNLRCPANFTLELIKECKKFLNTKRYRVSYNTIIGEIQIGGLNFPDIKSIFTALKPAWVSRLLEKDVVCYNIADFWCKRIGFDVHKLIKMNFKSRDMFPIIQRLPEFYQDIFIAFNKCKTIKPIDKHNPQDLMTSIIWGNENFKFQGKCLYSENWIKSGIIYIKDLFGKDGEFINEDDILLKLKNKRNWIAEYIMIKEACKHILKICSGIPSDSINIIRHKPSLYFRGNMFDIIGKKCKFYYKLLIEKEFKIPYMQKVWCNELQIDNLAHNSIWKQIYIVKLKKMPIKKFAECSYKILSGTLPSGRVLSKWNKDISPECIICKVDEDMKHMLFACSKVKCIWKTIGDYFRVQIQWKHLVIGYYSNLNNTTRLLNWIFVLVCYSIFKINNMYKWKKLDYAKCNTVEFVIRNLILFSKIQECMKQEYIPNRVMQHIIDRLDVIK